MKFLRLNLKNQSLAMGGFIGALLMAALGLYLLLADGVVSQSLLRNSYDLSFDLDQFTAPDVKSAGVVIVYLDEKSFKDFEQSQLLPLDRKYHANLLNRLKEDGAKAVVMDIVFSDPGPPDRAGSDEKFAEAIRDNGRVVLGVDYNRPEADYAKRVKPAEGFKNVTAIIYPPLDQVLTYPYRPFLEAGARPALVQLIPDFDLVVRRHFRHLDDTDLEMIEPGIRKNVPGSLSWVAAQMLDLPVTHEPNAQDKERWLYYYGPPDKAIAGVGYSEATGKPPGYFKDKVVFVGARPKTGLWLERRDEMRSPYYFSGLRRFDWMPMVEVHATEFLNLLRHDWLTRSSQAAESMIVILVGIAAGFGLVRFKPIVATGIAFGSILVVMLVTQSVFGLRHVWFPWLIIVGAQIPLALAYAVVFRSLEWYFQRRKLEEERRRADARIREQAALLDKAADAIIVHDLNWKAQFWNKSAETLYGWSFAEVQPLNLKTEIFKGEKGDEGKLLEALQAAMAKGEWAGELRQTSKAGKALIVQSRWTLVRDEAGHPKSVLVINTDVTEQKKLESQFLRTQRMESIGTLAGGIAHDLNNVLSPILMGVEMMKMSAKDEFTNKMLSTMASSAKRGSDMVKQVLTFARGHEGEKSVLQLSHLVREMQKIVKDTFPKHIDFKTALAGDLWPILGDATQIHQIILNLCVNARDAMPDGGKIEISVKNVPFTEDDAKKFPGARAVNYVLLAASDNGTGIPPEIIDKIFEPFFTTKEIGKGTGLGLSTVISIIKSHGGFLDLQSTVGKGTTFNVYLPAAEAVLPMASTPVPPEALKGNGETIMLVDDEPGVLELTRHVLTHFGYKVVTAIHGADAMALYPQFKDKIKVVIMDMMMPVMDGPMAIRALRQQDPALPIIAISGLMAGDKVSERLGGEGVIFLPKPFNSEKLLLLVREALTAKPPERSVTPDPAQPRAITPVVATSQPPSATTAK